MWQSINLKKIISLIILLLSEKTAGGGHRAGVKRRSKTGNICLIL
jgi:hypothetical protein